eukprot:Gregarina_sp_Pseudo_9__3936@NODE_4081_length_490_cov_2_013304_g3752_i0_p1_GENE_NODE_4081_length_490_cov_2_013304_g3752_i0NODE_4081_length_490_cov_2_013304_g3752_i0_p1_ORF_typecomplete_len104_score3_40_NODE_4081_length_490_cov_2_013304_g3752_i018329
MACRTGGGSQLRRLLCCHWLSSGVLRFAGVLAKVRYSIVASHTARSRMVAGGFICTFRRASSLSCLSRRFSSLSRKPFSFLIAVCASVMLMSRRTTSGTMRAG